MLPHAGGAPLVGAGGFSTLRKAKALVARGRSLGRMNTLARMAAAGFAALLLLPVAAGADEAAPTGARVTLGPGASFRIPSSRSAVVSDRLNPCYLGITGADGKVDVVFESKDDLRGVVLLPGELVTNLGGTKVKGGSIPKVTCLISLLIYPAGTLLPAIPPK
jgi:hypothetical protein